MHDKGISKVITCIKQLFSNRVFLQAKEHVR